MESGPKEILKNVFRWKSVLSVILWVVWKSMGTILSDIGRSKGRLCEFFTQEAGPEADCVARFAPGAGPEADCV